MTPSRLSPQAQAIVDRFAQEAEAEYLEQFKAGHANFASYHQGRAAGLGPNLQAAIDSSPVLVDTINRAVQEGHLHKLALLPIGSHAGGQYDPRERMIQIPVSTLFDVSSGAEATFVLGHEVQHALNRERAQAALDAFTHEARTESSNPAAVHDYTPIIGRRLQAQRDGEAEAQLAGWNALLDRIKQTNPNPTLAQIYAAHPVRMADFIVKSGGDPATYTPKGLTFNPDLTLSPTRDNLTAMGTSYFDKAPDKAKLGDLGKSNYATLYGVRAVQECIEYEARSALSHPGQAPRMVVNMAQLKLSEQLLEEEGIDLRRAGIQRQPYLDSSQTPAALHHFDHTQDGPRDHQYVPIMQAQFPSPHRDRPLFDALRERLPGLSDEAVAQVLVQAKQGGIRELRQLDQVLLHEGNAWVMGRTPGDWAKVDLSAPVPPLQESLRQSDTLDQQRAQQLQQWQQQDQQQAQEHGARSMGMHR